MICQRLLQGDYSLPCFQRTPYGSAFNIGSAPSCTCLISPIISVMFPKPVSRKHWNKVQSDSSSSAMWKEGCTPDTWSVLLAGTGTALLSCSTYRCCCCCCCGAVDHLVGGLRQRPVVWLELLTTRMCLTFWATSWATRTTLLAISIALGHWLFQHPKDMLGDRNRLKLQLCPQGRWELCGLFYKSCCSCRREKL